MRSERLFKYHGLGNDFFVLDRRDGTPDLDPDAVRWLCDRRRGLGADGILSLLPSELGAARMVVHNADGSIAEMCGNGVRVFARYLQHAGLAETGDLAIGTRAGVRRVHLAKDGDVTVGMGRAALAAGQDAEVTVTVDERSWPARNVGMGNPHAVAFVADLADAGRLYGAPEVAPASAYPQGVNVEFVVDRGPRHVAMRVHERGSGETRSCGTGACAVAVAAARRDGVDPAATGRPETYTVDVPGGRLVVTEHPDGEVEMTGPAVIVAEGDTAADWL